MSCCQLEFFFSDVSCWIQKIHKTHVHTYTGASINTSQQQSSRWLVDAFSCPPAERVSLLQPRCDPLRRLGLTLTVIPRLSSTKKVRVNPNRNQSLNVNQDMKTFVEQASRVNNTLSDQVYHTPERVLMFLKQLLRTFVHRNECIHPRWQLSLLMSGFWTLHWNGYPYSSIFLKPNSAHIHKTQLHTFMGTSIYIPQ
jgi:hypothetical protein